MVDPTSTLNEDIDEEDAPRCGACGEPILEAPNHRVTTWVEDGSVEAVHFCDDDCLAEWRASRE